MSHASAWLPEFRARIIIEHLLHILLVLCSHIEVCDVIMHKVYLSTQVDNLESRKKGIHYDNFGSSA